LCGVTANVFALLTTAIRCESLRPLINGTILSNDMLFGAMIHYRCNVGFRLKGPRTRTCQADGTWSDHDPTCSGITLITAPATDKMILNHNVLLH